MLATADLAGGDTAAAIAGDYDEIAGGVGQATLTASSGDAIIVSQSVNNALASFNGIHTDLVFNGESGFNAIAGVLTAAEDGTTTVTAANALKASIIWVTTQ